MAVVDEGVWTVYLRDAGTLTTDAHAALLLPLLRRRAPGRVVLHTAERGWCLVGVEQIAAVQPPPGMPPQ